MQQEHTMEQATIVNVSTKKPRWYSHERNEAHYDSFYRYRTKYDDFRSDENRNNADL